VSLELHRLERAHELSGGIIQARCPACAEAGHDRKGEHLRVYPDGRFGCCVHPKDTAHRKRIFALVGSRERKPFSVKLPQPTVKVAATSVKAALQSSFGTLGTLPSNPCAYAREKNSIEKLKDFESCVPSVPSDEHDFDCEEPVPSVPKVETPPQQPKHRMPHLLADGTLVIPFNSPEQYHWWKGGQSIAQTRAECLRTATTAQQEENHDEAY
jgi:hypothetical protein